MEVYSTDFGRDFCGFDRDLLCVFTEKSDFETGEKEAIDEVDAVNDTAKGDICSGIAPQGDI